MSTNRHARDYVFGKMQKIKGFLSPLDGLMLSSFALYQNAEELSGSIAEIGVYVGRSYYLLRMMANDNERCVGMDIFEHGDVRTPYELFAESGNRLGTPVDDQDIIVGDTAKIDPQDLKRKHGEFRFFHIDGCHEKHYVLNDANVADQTLAPYGVICFDDFFNPQYPDVTIGVMEFLAANEHKYAIIAITPHKLYVCRKAYAAQYEECIKSAPLLRNITKVTTQMNGDEVLWCANRRSSQIAYRLATTMNVPTLARMAY